MKNQDQVQEYSKASLRTLVVVLLWMLITAFLFIWAWFYLQLLKIGRSFWLL